MITNKMDNRHRALMRIAFLTICGQIESVLFATALFALFGDAPTVFFEFPALGNGAVVFEA